MTGVETFSGEGTDSEFFLGFVGYKVCVTNL